MSEVETFLATNLLDTQESVVMNYIYGKKLQIVIIPGTIGHIRALTAWTRFHHEGIIFFP